MTMTENALFAPAAAPLTIAFLILPQASILEVASALDPLRSANRLLGREAYRWRVVSPDGAPVPLTCGIELPASGPPSAAEGAEALVVVAGYRLDAVVKRPLLRELRRLSARAALVGGIDAGPWVLARAGLLDGFRATVHWEDQEDFAARYPEVEVVPDRFVIDRSRATIGGAAAAADFMLALIAARQGRPLARQVATSFLMSARPGADPQVAPDSAMDPRVGAAIARMEQRLDAPEPVAATAAAIGLSARRLETLFRQALGTTPGAYGLSLRLAAARRMVTEQAHPLAEIALRTGFSAPGALSRAFRRTFGTAPSHLRRPLHPGTTTPGPTVASGIGPSNDGRRAAPRGAPQAPPP